MDHEVLSQMLSDVASGNVSPDEAAHRLRNMPFEDLGFVKIDHHRSLRKGFPETIYAAGKTPEQVAEIAMRMYGHGSNVLATRCSEEAAKAVMAAAPDAVYHQSARTVTLIQHPPEALPGYAAVCCAGTTDIPVAEEAAITAEMFGLRVERVFDIGVAGIHRLFSRRDVLDQADVVVVCAGMEGALPSVVAGLVEAPVIAVPTSIGYGASLGGLTALMAMLNSCATGVAVVNIDNGFGAGAMAALIQRRATKHNPDR